MLKRIWHAPAGLARTGRPGSQHRLTPRCWPVSGLTETTRAAHLPGMRCPVTRPDGTGAPWAGVFQWCLTGFWLGKGEPRTVAQVPCAACVGSDAAGPWARIAAYTAGPCPSARPLRGQRRSGAGHAPWARRLPYWAAPSCFPLNCAFVTRCASTNAAILAASGKAKPLPLAGAQRRAL